MQNKAFLEDAQPFRQYSGPYAGQNGLTTGYRHAGYVAGDMLLDIEEVQSYACQWLAYWMGLKSTDFNITINAEG